LSAEARGQAFAPGGSASVFPWLASLEGQLQGRFDLAELLRQLPGTLHRRPDAELQRGEVELTLASAPVEAGRHWRGHVRTGPLVAVVAGQPIELSQPIELAAALRHTPDGLLLDRLTGQSPFLMVQGAGSPAQGQVQLRLSLDALSAQLGHLFDWKETRLAGTLTGEIAWQQVEQAWSARAVAQLENWQLALPGQAAWTERTLTATAQAEGQLAGLALQRLTRLDVLVRSGADSLEAQLTEPTDGLTRQTQLPLAWTVQGELGSWLARAGVFAPLAVPQATGSLAASGRGRFGLTGGHIEASVLELRDFVLPTQTLVLREPTVRVEAAGRWDVPSATCVVDAATLTSTALALRASGLHLVAGGWPVRSGTIDLRGDLARWSAWRAASQPSPTSQFGGSVTGRLELASQEGVVRAGWSADIEPLVWQRYSLAESDLRGRAATTSLRPVVWWHEPRVHLQGRARWDAASRQVTLEHLELAGSSLQLRGNGTWDLGRDAAPLEWNGELTCDWEALTNQVHLLARQSALADGSLPLGLTTLQLRGRSTRPLVANGPLRLAAATEGERAATNVAGQPLTPAQAAAAPQGALPAGQRELWALWSGQASLQWDEARYVGLVAGPTELAARLEGGVLAIGPLDIPLAEGRLRAAPQVMLAAARPAVRLPGGQLLEGVRISPEMCAQWLKFVAPLVAEATRAEGTLSLELAGGELPLEAPWEGQLAGTLHVHAAQIGPGPLAQQYLAVARQLLALTGQQPGRSLEEQFAGRAWLVLPAQQVPFALQQGSVVHRGLMLQVGDLTVVTQGRVHVATQQLDLAASFALPESWFRQVQGPLAALRGQTITLPISGTLSRPRVEMQSLQGLGKQLAAGVVEGLLRDALQPAPTPNQPQGAGDGAPRGALLPELGRGLERLLGPKSPPSTPPPARLPR
jgi:hypothetical protein